MTAAAQKSQPVRWRRHGTNLLGYNEQCYSTAHGQHRATIIRRTPGEVATGNIFRAGSELPCEQFELFCSMRDCKRIVARRLQELAG